MVIPLSSFSGDSYEKTLREIHQALIDRADGNGWSIYQGAPDAKNLPSVPVGIWIRPISMNPDADTSTLNATHYVSQWNVAVVHQETDAKKPDSDYYPIYRIVGQLVESLTTSTDDLSLDGAVEFIVEPSVSFTPNFAAGDKRCVGAEFRLAAHHPLFPIRCG